jgi:hypothetical protein
MRGDAMTDHAAEQDGAPVKVLEEILRVQQRMTRATVALYLVLALFGGVAWSVRANDTARVDEIATTNQTALCALRTDVERRIISSEQFLEDHPNGIPGISAATIRQSLTAQRETVDALSAVECPA